MEKKDVWSTSDILANRNNWSLAADAELLKHLQTLSEKIFAKASSTLQSLKSFENDVNQTCISIANTSNKFKSLSDTQFIESKVQEENSDISEQTASKPASPDNQENQNTTVKLKEAIENGFRVLDTQYDVIPVSGSDSEDDGPEEILLRARNPYLIRRLPHIIGSEEFTRNDNLGLIDSSSEEEDEEEEDDDEEDNDDGSDDNEEKGKQPLIDSDEESIMTQKTPTPKKEFLRPRTEIIRISSSDSEESEVSIPCDRSNTQEDVSSQNKKKSSEKSKDNEFNQNPNSFAEHLNTALKNNQRNIYSIAPPDFGDTFSPPPFPGKNNDISSEDDSEDDSDIFAPKKNTKHSISNTNYKSMYDGESDNDGEWHTKETGVISKKSDVLENPLESPRKSSIVSKTSQHSDTSSSSIGNESIKKDSSITRGKLGSQSLPKSKIIESNANSVNKKMASAINAELSAKLNLKNPFNTAMENPSSAKTSVKSSENPPSVETSAKSSENNTPVKTTKPKAVNESIQSTNSKKEYSETTLFDKINDESSSENDDEDDLFKGISAAKKTASKSKKSKGLFDDDDNIDNLFSPVNSAQSTAKKSNDLFSSEPSKPVKSDKTINESAAKPSIVDLKKSDLFASDSDSEDDIFSIIKGQKKVATDVFKTKTHDLFENNSTDSKSMPNSNNETSPIKTPEVDLFKSSFSDSKPKPNLNRETLVVDPVIKSAPLEITSSPLFTEEKLPFQSTSIKTTSSAEQNIYKKNEVINASKNSLFENVKKTTADLFQSDDEDDDLFSKKFESGMNENTNMSKSVDLFADACKVEKLKTGIFSSTENISNVDNMPKNSNSEFLKNIEHSTSDESLNKTENPSLFVKNTAQSDKVNHNIATIQSPNLSSSSDDEDLKKQSIFSKDSDASKEDEHKKTVAMPSKNKNNLFEESSDKSDLFGEYGKFSTDITNSENNDMLSSTKDDLFGETYESRSATFSPPKDDLTDEFSEDDDIKESNYLSQEDDDLFAEKFEPPLFQRVVPDDNISGKKSSTDSQEQLKKSFIIDTAPVDDLFTKSDGSLLVNDVFHGNDLFNEQKGNLEKNKELLGNNFNEESYEKSNQNANAKDQVTTDDKKLIKDGSIEKPSISNEDKFHSVDISSISKLKDNVPSVSEKSGLFGLDKKELFESDSDESDVMSYKNANPILIESKEIAQILPSEKIISPDKQIFSKDKKLDEKSQDDSAIKEISKSSEIDKISTSVSEKKDPGEQGKDVQDGNIFTKGTSPEPVSPVRSTPGKLVLSRGLNINVNALLPGNNWSSKMKQKQNTEQSASDEKQGTEPATPSKSQDVSEKSSALLNSVIKERPKISGKRRPPSRQARISRILTDNVFGAESFQEGKKLNVSSSSPKVREEIKVDESEKLEKSVTFKDDLFGDDEDKKEDLFGISGSRKEPIIEKSDVIMNTQISNRSSSLEGNDRDLNLDINSSLNLLPNLTKDRAKPRKRSPQPKKPPSNISSVVVDEYVTPIEPESKPPVIKKLDASVEERSSFSNLSKQDASSTVTPSAKSIFDSLDDDDNDLFESLKSRKIIEEKPTTKETKPTPKSSQQPAITKPKTTTNAKIDIFNDDDEGDELFSSAKKKLSTNKLSKKSSLFEDNDDDDLFGAKTSASSSRKTSEPATASIKTKPLNERPRILKLRSETVQKDPLSGKDLTGPL